MNKDAVKQFLTDAFQKSRHDFAGYSVMTKEQTYAFDVLCQDMLCSMINNLSPSDKKDIFSHLISMIEVEQTKSAHFPDKKTFSDRILLKTIHNEELDDDFKNKLFALELWGAASRVSFSEEMAEKATQKMKKAPATFSHMRNYWAAVYQGNQRAFLNTCLKNISVKNRVDLVVSIGDCWPNFWADVFEHVSPEDGFFILEKAGHTIKNQSGYFKEISIKFPKVKTMIFF